MPSLLPAPIPTGEPVHAANPGAAAADTQAASGLIPSDRDPDAPAPPDAHPVTAPDLPRRVRRSRRSRTPSRPGNGPARVDGGIGGGNGSPLRVAIYLRISTDELHQPFSLEAQELKLTAYVTSQDNWELACPAFVDQASGATTDRPALQRALNAARAGRFDVLLVYCVDRLSRSIRGLSDILASLDDIGVAFRSATEPFDTATPAGRMMVQMLAVFAEFERATIIDRVINGMERKAARGQWCGGYRPHGYDLDRATGFLVPLPDEAAVVHRIFRLYTRDRVGTRAVANTLNADGHRTKSGKPWSGAAVLTVLRNRVYLGEVFYRDQWHKADPHHPPLISTDLFDEAEQVLIVRGDDHTHRTAARSHFPLAGLIFCARCGKRYQGTTARGNRYTYRYYTCFTRQRYGTASCPSDRLPAEQVENGVVDSLLATLARTDLIDAALEGAHDEAQAERASHVAELGAVESEIAKAEASIDRYLTAFENGTMPEATCAPRVEAMSRKTGELRSRRDELGLLIDETPAAAKPTRAHLDALGDHVRARLGSDTPKTVQALLQAMTVRIDVAGRDSITPTFRIPAETPAPPQTAPEPHGQVRTLPGSVPPAGFEPAPPPPEGGALSPELRGRHLTRLAHAGSTAAGESRRARRATAACTRSPRSGS